MTFRRVGTTFIIRLFRGEEINGAIKDFAIKYGITAGSVSGIGATDDVVIGFFDEESKKYITKNFEQPLEILNLAGNIAMVDNEPFPHLHILLGDRNFNVTGGHLVSARVSVTCEIYLFAADSIISREIDESTGLKLLKL